MQENREQILLQLCKCYDDLGEDLFLLTALLAYGGEEETDGTMEECCHRLGDYIGQRRRELIQLSSALARQPV